MLAERRHLSETGGKSAALALSLAPSSVYEPLADRGRKHITQDPSSTWVFRPRRKVIPPRASIHEPSRGRKPLEAPKPAEARPRGKQQVPEQANRYGLMGEPAINLVASMQVVMDQHGNRVRDRVSDELSLEIALGMKRKLDSRRQRRNFIPDANPGDKLFRDVDYSPGFHKQSTGSGFRSSREGPPETRKASETLTYEEKRKLQTYHEERSEALDSIIWEERTGMFTLAPEEESDEDEQMGAQGTKEL
ncbi:unnamed protein product [Chrysoparadoxa australica]